MNDILASKADGILHLQLNRPSKKNALTQPMYALLAEQFRRVAVDPDVRVVLIEGAPDCFCAGNDLVDFLGEVDSRNGPIGQYMQAMAICPQPIVAAPAGLAIGIGFTLLLHCDLVYCGASTRLQMPFVKLGLCPEFASTYLVPLLAGYPRAAELLLLGEAFSAQDALAMGLVTRLAPNAEVAELARCKARELAALPPNAVRTTKRLMRRWSEAQALSAIKVEVDDFLPMLRSPEAQQAFAAFARR